MIGRKKGTWGELSKSTQIFFRAGEGATCKDRGLSEAAGLDI